MQFSIKRLASFKIAAAALVVFVALSGCGSKEEGQGSTAAATSTPGTGTQGAGGSYTIEHAMGKTTIPAAPKKVVILTNEGTEALLAMGVKPVGAVQSWTGNPWYEHIKADMEGVQDLGKESQPNIEAIAALKPDLILGNKMRHEKIYEQLSAVAPTVFTETLRGEWKNNFMVYAEALNKKAEGQKIIADFDARAVDFKNKAGDKLKNQVSVVRFMPGKTRIYYQQTFSGIIFQQLGITRPAAQNKDEFAADVSKERIPEMEGDLLFYFTYETGDGSASALEKEWLADPLWNNLNVVKNKKVFKVSDTIWNTAGGVKAANLLIDDLYKHYELKP
jgi:iron complex transport system substrate-binding protein